MKKILLILLMFFTTFSITSCSGFFSEEALEIVNIRKEIGKNENGDSGFYIIIEYANPDKLVDKFFVPDGKQGETGLTGNGIEKFETVVDEVSKETTITVTFTDKDMKPVTYKVPLGVSIKAVNAKPNSDGSNEIVFEFSDGSKSDPFIIPKGEKGDGYESHEIVVDKKTGDVTLKLTFTNHEPIEIVIPKGDKGNGIESVFTYYNDILNVHIIQFTMTDGSYKEIEIPAQPTWRQGNGVPANSLGFDGDFYFDIAHRTIYSKNNNAWSVVVVLENSETKLCNIRFDLNDKDEGPQASMGGSINVKINYGEYFGKNGNGALPEPNRDGYVFAGWYLVKNPGINNGAFTDTTPVLSDLVLYANWIKE